MPSHESINKLIDEALQKLNIALADALNLSREVDNDLYKIGTLGRSIGLLREFQAPILEKYPELKPPPPWAGEVEPSLTEEQQAIIATLPETLVHEIDEALLSYASSQFQKVAKIVGIFMTESSLHSRGIPYIFYAQRIEELANNARLEYQGNLKFMRHSEVRVPKT